MHNNHNQRTDGDTRFDRRRVSIEELADREIEQADQNRDLRSWQIRMATFGLMILAAVVIGFGMMRGGK